MKTIMCKNGKGGDGKTITSINLSAMYAMHGYSVLHIDTDVRHHSSNFFQKNINTFPTGSIGEWLLSSKSKVEVIMKSRFENIDFISCSEDIDDQMQSLVKSVACPQGELKKKLTEVDDAYDYCIIDCSQNADVMALNTFVASDLVMIPVKCGEDSKSGVAEMITWINQVKDGHVNANIDYLVFISDKEKNKEADTVVNSIADIANEHLCKTKIRHQAKPLTRGSNTGIPIVFEKKLTNIALDYLELYKELVNHGI